MYVCMYVCMYVVCVALPADGICIRDFDLLLESWNCKSVQECYCYPYHYAYGENFPAVHAFIPRLRLFTKF